MFLVIGFHLTGYITAGTFFTKVTLLIFKSPTNISN